VRIVRQPHDVTMARTINFSPGPGTLPLSVLEEAQSELLEYGESGISMLEHSHRGASYSAVHAECKASLTRLLGCGDTHEILFMTGGASTQFALLPMNFLGGESADYVDTGVWSKKAFGAAKHYGKPRWAASGRHEDVVLRAPSDIDESDSARYVHITSNATVSGVQYATFPRTKAPLVVDVSSDILHKPLDLSEVSLAYAGAQKNLGPAGVTLVIVRKDFLAKADKDIPDIFRYAFFAEQDSLGNTPPTFAIYMVGKVLKWIEDSGGASSMGEQNAAKGARLYGVIDAMSDFYRCPVEVGSRSLMNAVFHLPSDELTTRFVAEAAAQGMVNLKGHRSIGGIRASMYNATPLEHVEKLANFMTRFATENA
jgi:phosphoserine aminotransferase